MWNRKTLVAVTLGLAVIAGFVTSLLDSADAMGKGKRYEITITNMTRGQIMSPAVVALHTDRMAPLWAVGTPASDGITANAEDAVNDTLVAALEADPQVREVATITGAGGPIMPGETAMVTVSASGKFKLISLVGMLVTTNDAFYGGQSIPLSKSATTTTLVAYDSGTEENNELCTHIPGPPCGNPGVRATDGAEGYIYVHSGVHGVGDLDPALHDWNNPVARITIRRVK